VASSASVLWKNLLSCISRKKKKKKEILLFFFWIKTAVGFFTLENWEKCFQMGGLALWLYAFLSLGLHSVRFY